MARRTLSTQGRVLAAGVSIAVASGLAGFMAAGDHSAGASATGSSQSGTAVTPSSGDGGVTASPYGDRTGGDDGGGFGNVPSGDTGLSPQPQTRTGGS